MNSRLLGLVLAAGLVSCGGSPDAAFGTGGSAAAVRVDAQICAVLDGYLSAGRVDQAKVRGYSFIVFDQDSTLLTCAGGNQGLDAVLPIASASKLPSAAAIMSLVDDGRLMLDLPVSLYLVGSGVNWPPDKSAITMRMLLAHTSGLPGLGAADAQVACLDQISGITMQECVRQIAALPLVTTPGQAFNYGGADYQVAGFIASRVAGQSWQDFFSARIGAPLGLDVFSYGDPLRVSNPRVAGGAVSNVADYQAILQMLLRGGGDVLSADAVGVLETNQIAGTAVRYSPTDTGAYPGYTFGLFISAAFLHPGSAGPELSGPGLLGTIPWIDLDLGYGAVLLIEDNTATGLAMWNAVRPLIITALNDSSL